MTPALPPEVIDKDRRLQRSADELMELRWHWTIDPDNAERVTFADYARAVGGSAPRIRNDARAWEEYLRSGARSEPGKPQTPTDYRELINLSEQKQEAAQAIAKATGANVGNVARHKRADVQAVLDTAREHAVERGTTVEHEIDKAAEWHAKTQRAAKAERERSRSNLTSLGLEVERDLGRMLGIGRDILSKTQGVDESAFPAETREALGDVLGKLRAMLRLLEVQLEGATNVDWDAELVKLGNGS